MYTYIYIPLRVPILCHEAPKPALDVWCGVPELLDAGCQKALTVQCSKPLLVDD